MKKFFTLLAVAFFMLNGVFTAPVTPNKAKQIATYLL
jgi:hypothetical protein